MPDPSLAMQSFQQAHLKGQLQLQQGSIDPEIWCCFDPANGKPRFIYMRLERQTITAFVMLVGIAWPKGTHAFQIGCAVPSDYRGEGRAKSAVHAAIVELQHGLAGANIHEFFVEAVVAPDNLASQRVAHHTISPAPVEIVDHFTGQPALRYIRRFGKHVTT